MKKRNRQGERARNLVRYEVYKMLRERQPEVFEQYYEEARKVVYDRVGYNPQTVVRYVPPAKHKPDPDDPEYCVKCDKAWPCPQNRKNTQMREYRRRNKNVEGLSQD